MKKISIVIPIYNVEKYLRKCLDSIKNQIYSNYEVLMVDDGSPDNCGTICDEYAKADNRFIALHKENGGVSSARNLGLEKSTGDYICFIDPDDYIDLNFLNVLVKSVDKTENRIAVCKYHRIEDNSYVPSNNNNDTSYKMSSTEFIAEVLLENDLGGGVIWNKIFPATLAKKVKFDTNLNVGEDLKFLMSVLKEINEVIIIENKLYYSVYRNGSLSKTYKEVNLKKEEELCKEILNSVKDSNEYLYKCAIKRYLSALSYLIVYSNNYKDYKKEIKKGQKLFYKIIFFNRVRIKEKMYIFLKLFFPKMYRYLKKVKHEKNNA